jgi:hypothetical protein
MSYVALRLFAARRGHEQGEDTNMPTIGGERLQVGIASF